MASGRSLGVLTVDMITNLSGYKKGLNEADGLAKRTGRSIEGAFKTVGNSLRTFIPLTVAGAVTSLGYAFVKASQESQAFNKAIYLSGNYAGTTAYNLSQMAQSIKGFTQGQASEVLAQITTAGKFTEEQLKQVASSALLVQRAFDIPVTETISAFEKLADSPVKAVIELNKQYNFLTASTYDQIKALQDQGRAAEASNLAINTFAQAQQQAAEKAINNAGYLQRSWVGVKGAIDQAIDSIVNFGRANTNAFEERLKGARRELNALTSAANKLEVRIGWNNTSPEKRQKDIKELERLRGEAERVQLFIDGFSSSNNKTPTAQLNKELLDARTNIDQLTLNLEDNANKQKKIIDQLTKDYQKIYQSDKNDPRLKGINFIDGMPSGGEYERLKQQAIKRYSDNTRSSVASNSSSNIIQQLKDQEALLRQQLETGEKLTTSQQKLVKLEEQLTFLRQKDNLTNAEKRILATADEHREQLKVNAALEEQITLRKSTQELQKWISAQNDSLNTRLQGIDVNLLAMGMSSKQAQDYREILKLQEEYAQARRRLVEMQAEENKFTSEQYQVMLENTDNYYAQLIAKTEEYQLQRDQLEQNWTVGFNKAFQDYADSAQNYSQMTADFFNNTVGSMSSHLTDFLVDGKANFNDFAKSILKDITSIGTRIATSNILKLLFGGFSASSSLDSLIGTSGLFAKGGAFNEGFQAFAIGGAFTNSIVNKPTLFPFAKGTGLMGEAGPEAIMPLARTSSGDLGVKMITDKLGGSQQLSETNIQVYVNIDGNGNATTSTNANQAGNDLALYLDEAMKRWTLKEKRQGGLLDPNNRRNQ